MFIFNPHIEGIQPYKPGKRIAEVRRELAIAEIFKLSSNEAPLGPVEQAQQAMAKAIKGLNRYPDGSCHLLKTKLAERLGVGRDELLIGNGSNELLRLLAQVLISPGDEVVAARPSFIVYPLITKMMGGRLVEVGLNDFTHDLEAMAGAVTERTKLVFVCNPNNPTGTAVGATAIERFLAAVPPRVVVCFDEAYHEYVTDPDYKSALELRAGRPNVVVMRTFSKIYGLAGARIGYGVCHPSIGEAIDKVREPFNVNIIAQVGAYYSLDAADEIARRRRDNYRERERVGKALSDLGYRPAASQANFVFFSTTGPASEIFTRLQERGVIVRPVGDDCLRVTLGTPAENDKFIRELGN